MKKKANAYVFVEAFVILMGIVITFVVRNIFDQNEVKLIIEDIGVALLAAGPVSLLVRNWRTRNLFLGALGITAIGIADFFVSKDVLKNLGETGAINKIIVNFGAGLITLSVYNFISNYLYLNDGTIRIKASERRTLDKHYKDMKLAAQQKIYVLATSINGALDDFIVDKKVKQKIEMQNSSLDIKYIFVNPVSKVVAQRAIEDGRTEEDLRDKIKESVKRSLKLYRQFSNHMAKSFSSGKSTFEIKITKMHPLHSVVIIDDKPIQWAVITCDNQATREIVLEIPIENQPIYSSLKSHFDSLWKHSDTEMLISIDLQAKTKYLNENLLQSIYGDRWKKDLGFYD